ncbi:hypothetical protein FSARC_12106 [Fusarium sarcochroum]|uniref:Major facilitator superfamily (MFS) profile domain-containing protein n=1 Tax=Fusarium sarcochroum TaxID=1208366 RepID=A0A8H4TAX3_9HYPO|nr:hypothetical protein FSARC_12106 [Fusarium sarcochroum]
MSGWLIFSIFVISMGSIFWGYDIGILSTIYVSPGFNKALDQPSSSEKGLITAIFSAGQFASFALIAGPINNKYGRRWAGFGGVCLLCVGAAIQTGAVHLAMMVIGRIIAGVGTGVVSTAVPLYLSEISPAKHRGLYVAANQVGIVSGISMAFWVGYGYSFWDYGNGIDLEWRLSTAMQFVPALLFLTGVPFIPESPRWLVESDQIDAASESLCKLRGLSASEIQPELDEIRANILWHQENSVTSARVFVQQKPLWSRLWRAWSLAFLQQMSGAAGIRYYLPTNFIAAGTSEELSLLASGIDGTVQVVCTVAAMFFIDKLGRRHSLGIGAIIMAFCLMINGALQTAYPGQNNQSANYVNIFFIFFFTVGYSMGFGPCAWIYASEIFPANCRSKGLAISSSGSSLGSIIVGQVWPIAVSRIGPRVYFIFMSFNVFAAILVYACYPETKGKTLEELDTHFGSLNVHSEEDATPKQMLGAEEERIEIRDKIMDSERTVGYGRSGDVHPRSHIHDLEAQLMRLEAQLQEVDDATIEVSPPTSTLRSDDEPAQDLIRVGDEGHAHFIGASSGMYLVRSVLESAQQNYPNFESPPETTEARAGPKEPAISGTGIALPSRETANSLIDTFFKQYQVQYPILDQQEFTKAVADFYSRQNDRDGQIRPASGDVWTRFMLNMVLAISLMFMSNDHDESTTLSKGFTANAMADISLIMQTKNVESVQCLLLLLLLSILDSSSAPVWYISGLCMRMCIDLGYHSETTIAISSSGDDTEVQRMGTADTKRRLFWVTYSFDRTLNILLGRPFTFDDFTVDINLPRHSLLPSKRPQILHWLELQRLESDIVHKLHAEEEGADLAQWTIEMAQRLKSWNSVALTLTDSDGHNVNWWGYWYRKALLILYRPSPSRPNLSTSDTLSCYEAAKDVIQLSFLRISEGLMDFTWIDLHFQFMSGVTLVFIVWKNSQARIRAKDDWVSFKSCLFQWKSILVKLGARWERIARAREALSKLADATIDLVEKDMMRSAGEGQRLPIHHDSEEARRDRRRSIIQQLRRQDSDGISQQNQAHTGDDASMQDSSPRDLNLGTNSRRIIQIYGAAMNNESQTQSSTNAGDHATQSFGENWTAFEPPTNTQQQGLFGDGQSQNNISSMAPEDTWPLFDLSDVAIPPDELNFWTYLSAPMLGVEDMATSQFNATGRPDESFTNSILNFHGDFNITPEMPVEYPEDGDYGYNAGQ